MTKFIRAKDGLMINVAHVASIIGNDEDGVVITYGVGGGRGIASVSCGEGTDHKQLAVDLAMAVTGCERGTFWVTTKGDVAMKTGVQGQVTYPCRRSTIA